MLIRHDNTCAAPERLRLVAAAPRSAARGRRKTKRLIIDTIGCAIGGYTSEPSKIARDLASAFGSGRSRATIIGSGQTASPDLAAFVNGVMIRYLDYNDGYTSTVSGHPSDNISAVLSSAEAAGADGERVIAATVLAYEMYCRFSIPWTSCRSTTRPST